MYSCNAVNGFHQISPGGLSLEIFVELFFQVQECHYYFTDLCLQDQQ